MRTIRTLVSLLVAMSACQETRTRNTSSTPRQPSCALPICGACACDLTTACDSECNACDPECGQCRAEGAACRNPQDAGELPDVSLPDFGFDGSVEIDGSVPPDSGGTCAFPAAQPLGAPCCDSRGIDACSLNLFCAAFDGRTQTICYQEGSRQQSQTCTADVQCASGECAEGLCRQRAGSSCTQDGECASGDCAPNGKCSAALGETCEEFAPYPCREGLECSQGACVETTPPPDPECTITTSEPCGPTERCSNAEGTTICEPAGPGGTGTACTEDGQCQRGYICVTFSSVGCARICNPNVTDSCGPGVTCFSGGGLPFGLCLG